MRREPISKMDLAMIRFESFLYFTYHVKEEVEAIKYNIMFFRYFLSELNAFDPEDITISKVVHFKIHLKHLAGEDPELTPEKHYNILDSVRTFLFWLEKEEYIDYETAEYLRDLKSDYLKR